MAIERTFSIIKPDATARNLTGAVNAVIELIQLGVPVARVEFLDENGVRAINAHDHLGLPEQPLLLLLYGSVMWTMVAVCSHWPGGLQHCSC